MSAIDRYLALFAFIRKPWLRRLLAAVLALAVLIAVLLVLANLLPSVPPRFWQLLGLCAAALAVLWWFTSGARRYSRAGIARQRIGDLGPGNPDDERVPLEKMQQAIRQAKQAILRSPEIAGGRNPLYRVPWFLFLGDADADMPGMLHAAAKTSPFPPPATDDPEQEWRWWFFKSMLAVEMSPRIICDASDRLQRGLWYQALMQLAAERDQLPLNGIVLCVAAQSLLGDPDALKTLSMRLRRLVDEAMEHLQVGMPVYFVVTGLERLTGYDVFRKAVPAETFAQALGFRLPETETITAGTSARLDEIYGPIAERLHALRMTALRAQSDAHGRRGVFEFVESIAHLGQGLRQFVALLLEDNPFQRTPRWRGLYLTGAATTAAPDGAFVADLFTRFLPSDQPLASTSFKGNTGRLAVAGTGVAVLLAFSAYLSYGIAQARQDDANLLAQTHAACTKTESSGASARIAWVAACGRTIEQLETSANGTLLGFGIRRSDRDIERLKREVVSDFSSLILAPYDQTLEANLARGDVGIEDVLALTQRLRMLRDCRGGGRACLDRELKHNVAFDPRARLFAPFLSANGDTRTDRDNAAALLTTYAGYLRWQRSFILNDEQQRLHDELSRVLTTYTLRAPDIQAWADARHSGLHLGDFWLQHGSVVGVAEGNMPAISSAYTLDTWKGVVRPMLETLDRQLPGDKALDTDFQHAYFNAYFQAWGQFEGRFFEGVKLWKGRDDALATRAAGADNPYRFFFESTDRNLLGLPLDLPAGLRWHLAWQAMKGNWLHAWKPLWTWTAVGVSGWFAHDRITPPTWLLAVLTTRRDVLDKQQVLYANGYLRLQAQGGDQNLYRIAVDIYRSNGAPTSAPASDYTTLLQAVAKPDDAYAAKFTDADLLAWSVVQGPARLLLFLTMHRAAQYVQQQWKSAVVEPLSGMDPKQQAAALYGPQGKLNAFVNDWLKPFVTEHERTPVRVAGVAIPLSPSFQAMVGSEQKFLPVIDQNNPFPAGTFAFSAPTSLGRLQEGTQGTVIEVDCQQRIYSAASNAPSLAGAKVEVFWSPNACPQAQLRIDIAAPTPVAATAPAASESSAKPPPAPLASAPPTNQDVILVRVYSGADGFVKLFHDFADGAHSFGLADFRASYNATQWSELVSRLQAQGFSRATVNLRATPSDNMTQYMAARNGHLALPTSIID